MLVPWATIIIVPCVAVIFVLLGALAVVAFIFAMWSYLRNQWGKNNTR